jgi:hypothetical protein
MKLTNFQKMAVKLIAAAFDEKPRKKAPIVKNAPFLIIDTETTNKERVFDIGIVLCDGNTGKIIESKGFLIQEVIDAMCFDLELVRASVREGNQLETLYFDQKTADFWGLDTMPKRWEQYCTLERDLITINELNDMLKAYHDQGVTFTAYNDRFDKEKLANTGIITNYALWIDLWGMVTNTLKENKYRKKYVNFALQQIDGVKVGRYKVLSVTTSCDLVCKHLFNTKEEPHTALEDARDYEARLLQWLLTRNCNSGDIPSGQHDYAFWRASNILQSR